MPNDLSYILELKYLEILPGTERRPSNLWWPPLQKARFRVKSRHLFRWTYGTLQRIQGQVNLGAPFRTVTVFTQHPDSDLLLVLRKDATKADVQPSEWRNLSFQHRQVGNVYQSIVACAGDEPRQAAGSNDALRQLLPACYSYSANSPQRQNGGLIGNLALLSAIGAFSAKEVHAGNALVNSTRRNRWATHSGLGNGWRESAFTFTDLSNNRPDENKRGLVATIYLDPSNPTGSTQDRLRRLEAGDYGAFYNQ